jgi:TfoX/Sxy family transcriptional regulator of competence genes
MGSKAMMERFAAVVEALAGEANVSVGQKGRRGFGSSALQVNGKIFAMISSSGSFVVKLPKQRVEELEASGVGAKFNPGHGRLMKEWLALNQHSAKHCLPLAREALRFVGSNS